MQQQNHNWERIESIILWTGMSVNGFAHHIGLLRGENLYQIKRGNNGISRDLADRIVASFPQIDKLWLLTGEGQMFAEPRLRSAQIPCYREDLLKSIRSVDRLEPECRMLLPQVDAFDFAMLYLGREMGVATPAGTTVVLRRIAADAIIPGREYVVVSQKIVTLRIIRVAERTGWVKLVAGDRENYDDILLNIKEIESVYEVKAKLIINN